MPSVMKVDDPIRLRIIDALLDHRSVKPNLLYLQQVTGYHKATLVSSLKFLEKQGVFQGCGPKLNFRSLGYKLEVTTLLQANLVRADLVDIFLKQANSDKNLYWFSGMLGSNNWNWMMRHIHADVESYRQHMQSHYFSKIPNIYDLIKDQQIIFTTEPVYKSISRTKSLIEVIKKSKAMD